MCSSAAAAVAATFFVDSARPETSRGNAVVIHASGRELSRRDGAIWAT